MTKAEEKALEAYPVNMTPLNYQDLIEQFGGKTEIDINTYPRCLFQEGYEQAEKDLGWISVEDRLPKERGWYFTCINHYGTPQALGVTYYDGKEWLDDDDSTENVDYWMEVPKLPKEEENETK